MRYVVYEVWTQARVIDAESIEDAYDKGEPEAREDLNLSNWHVVPLDDAAEHHVGTLNYRQVKP